MTKKKKLAKFRAAKETLDNKDMLLLLMLYQGSPSIHELCDAIQAKSTGTVAARLNSMQDAGYVVQPSARKIRSRFLTEKGLRALVDCSLITPEAASMELEKRDAKRLPVSCGT